MHLGYKQKVRLKVINVAKLNMNSEIKNVEKRLQKAIESNDPILREASSHLLSSGGKELDLHLLY